MRSWDPTTGLAYKKLTDRDIAEQLALAFLSRRPTIHIFIFYIVKEMLLEAVAAETLARWSNRFTVLACLHIAPMYVQSVFSCLADFVLIGFKFRFRHHFAAICTAYDAVVFNISLDVLCCVVVNQQSFNHQINNSNLKIV